MIACCFIILYRIHKISQTGESNNLLNNFEPVPKLKKKPELAEEIYTKRFVAKNTIPHTNTISKGCSKTTVPETENTKERVVFS